MLQKNLELDYSDAKQALYYLLESNGRQMTDQHELAQLDRDSKAAQVQVDQAAALERLYTNRDFKRLILDGFLRDEAIRLVHLKGSPDMQAPAQQTAIVRDIDAIATLSQHFGHIRRMGKIAEKQIGQINEMREDIIANPNKAD